MTDRCPVLVVDDDEAILDLVQMALEMEGYDVAMARDGLEALGLLASVKPALILLDMRMPGMDGWRFARAYRATPDGRAGARAPVVVMTAAVDASKVAAEIQAEGFLAKPFDVEKLLATVRGHVKTTDVRQPPM